MNERIRKLRRHLDLTQKEFGDRIGVKGNTVATYEGGRNQPIDSVISLICKEFNVNREWLLTGEGEMFMAAPTDELDALAEKYHLRHKDYVFVEKLIGMTEAERDVLFRFMSDVVSGATAFGADPDAYVFPKAADSDPQKLHAELDRQLALEKAGEGRSEVS